MASRSFDVALAGAFALLSWVELLTQPDLHNPGLAGLLAGVICSTLVLRRRHPVAAVAVTAAALAAASVVDMGGNFPPVSGVPVIFLLAYSCGVHAPVRSGLAAIAGLIVAMQLAAGFADFPNFEILFIAVPPWWVGWEVGRRRRLVSALHERTRELEAEEQSFVALSVQRERARIARELHDIVAHQLAVIVVQAGAGRMAGTGDATPPEERLASIRQSGDQALAEMSRLVDIIHADQPVKPEGAERLRRLVEDAEAAGLEVSLRPLPGEAGLPADVEDDALRVIQECLTNAMKHAPGARVSVRLALLDGSLGIEVRDHGGRNPSGLAETGAGLGLSGMRERIESLGGSLEAGPCADGGWRVRARVPVATSPLAAVR